MAFDPARVVSTVTHNGVKVFINDLTACTNTADVLLALEAMVANTRLQASKMRTVTNITGVTLDSVAMDRANLLGKEVFNAMALRSAVVGVVGYKKILLRTFSFFSGMVPVPFETVAAALDYVTKDK